MLEIFEGEAIVNKKRTYVLMVEDNPAFSHLANEALRRSAHPYHLRIATDGEQAMTVLTKHGTRKPDVILLDLNLPKKNGFEILAEIKQHEELQGIPVVFLTSSSRQEDIDKAKELKADDYIIKPIDFKTLVEAMRQVITTVATTSREFVHDDFHLKMQNGMACN